MTRFAVTRDYRAVYRSAPIGFDKGAVVDVDEPTAEWVNNDSPGCLVPADETPTDDAPPRSRKSAARKPAAED